MPNGIIINYTVSKREREGEEERERERGREGGREGERERERERARESMPVPPPPQVRYTGGAGQVPVNAPSGDGRISATISDVKGSSTYTVTVTARNGQPVESDRSDEIMITTKTGGMCIHQ